MKADLVVFDPQKVQDRSTYEDPHHFSEGVAHVIVNGKPVLRDGKMTGALPGRVLRLWSAGTLYDLCVIATERVSTTRSVTENTAGAREKRLGERLAQWTPRLSQISRPCAVAD